MGPSELLREANQRNAVKEVAHSVGRGVEEVASNSFVVGEFEVCGPSPAEPGELEVGGCKWALCSPPSSLEGVGE